MVSGELSPETERAIKLEERAHRLRLAMLRDPDFVAGIRAGYEDALAGRVVPLEDLDRELGWD